MIWLVAFTVCAFVCCSVLRGGTTRDPHLDEVGRIEMALTSAALVDPTGCYPFPPPCNPEMIPTDFTVNADQFPSVTDRITTDYIYTE
jgi:hypothetical protein